MKIVGIIWLHDVISKLAAKHGVESIEVEELLGNRPRFQRIARGKVAGEDMYAVTGQTDAGRYLIAFFVYKRSQEALIVSARDMTSRERRRYGKQH